MSSVLELGYLELNFYDEHIEYDDHEEEAFRLVSSILVRVVTRHIGHVPIVEPVCI